jgi:plastocyanin
MKEKIATNALKKLPFFVGLMAMALLSMALVGFTDSSVVLASAQDSKTIQISIVSDASRLSNTAYQPNPINIKVGETVEWTNDDSSPYTVTGKSRSTNGNNSDDKSNSGIVEKIVDEIITNIVVNIRNNMGEGDNVNNSLKGNSLSSAEFDSGIMQTGQRFNYTFNNLGTFEYYCTVHPSMVTEIVVS